MIKNLRKAFTIIELVIVIAVIAVLAAVMIPTFSNLVKKAETAADIQTVKNFNTIVNAEGAAVGGIKTPHDAIEAVSKNGYNLEYITPTADGRTIVWDATNYQFVLLDEDNKVVYPNDNKVATPIANLFIVSNIYPATGYDGFAVYLTDGYTGGNELTVATGVDVGNNKQITKVTYEGTGEVLIRTNSESCDFVMRNGIVYHYGVALKAIVETTQENYHCYATLLDLTIYGGDIKPTTLFAGGQGTKEKPYLINSSEEARNISGFSNDMLGGTKYYFKLLNDIDLSDEIISDSCGLSKYFNGELDGNGHSLKIPSGCYAFYCVYDNSSAVIKNLTFIQPADGQSILIGFLYDDVTFENIILKTESDVTLNYMYGCSGFCIRAEAGSNYVFKNCVNEVSYYTQRGGIFVGNYIDTVYDKHKASFTFENCVNKGTVTGIDLSFFIGNHSQALPQLKNVDYGSFVIPNDISIYDINISGCRNEGLIMASNFAEPFAENLSSAQQDLGETKINFIKKTNELVDESMLSRGLMFVSNVEVGLKLNEDNSVSIININDSIINSYKYRIFVSTCSYKIVNGENKFSGNWTFEINEIVTSENANTAKLKYVSNVIYDKEYDKTNTLKFVDLEKKTTSSGITYAEIINEDGTYTWIISYDDVWTKIYKFTDYDFDIYSLTIGKEPYYSISAFDENETIRGFKGYDKGELKSN